MFLKIRNLILFVLISSAVSTSVCAQNFHWEKLQGPWGGNVLCSTRIENSLFIGTEGSGVFCSIDSGKSWVARNRGIEFLTINQILSRDSLLFVGTDSGMRWSTDMGSSWNDIDTNFGCGNIHSFTLEGKYLFFVFTRTGLLFRYNFSEHTLNTPNIDSGGYIDFIASWRDTLLATTYGDSLFVSYDTGVTWKFLKYGVNGYQLPPLMMKRKIILAGYQQSFDGGNTWSFDAAHNYWLDDSNVFKSGNPFGVEYSRDDGKTWTKVEKGYFIGSGYHAGPYPHNVTSIGSAIINLSEWGFFISNDSGKTWIARNTGIANIHVNKLTAYQNILITATQYDGFYRSTNSGLTWDSINDGMSMTYGYALIHLDSLFVCGNANGFSSIYATGNMWHDAFQWPAGPVGNTLCIAGRSIFGGSDRGIYFSRDGIHWYTDNNGLPYTLVFSGLNQWGDSVFRPQYWSCAQLSSYEDTIFASIGKSLYQTTITASKWDSVFAISSSLFFSSVLKSKDAVYAVIDSGGIIYRSFNNGVTWETTYGPSPLFSEGYQLGAYGTVLLAMSYSPIHPGVFYSIDHGDSWHEANTGLSDRRITSIAIDDKMMYVGTVSGIFYSELPYEFRNVGLNDSKVGQLRIFPNPTVDLAQVQVSSAKSSEMSLIIFDALGRIVAQPVIPSNEADGLHEITIDTRNFPPGVYTARLTGRDGEQIARFVKE